MSSFCSKNSRLVPAKNDNLAHKVVLPMYISKEYLKSKKNICSIVYFVKVLGLHITAYLMLT